MDPTLHSAGCRGKGFRPDDIKDLDQFAHQAVGVKDAMRGEHSAVPWRRQFRSIVALPFIVTLVVPAVLVALFRPAESSGQKRRLSLLAMFLLGLTSILLGLSLLVSTIRLFTTVGKGTLAPWDPAKSLVVNGPYRFVRNPMISGVLFELLGEALILGLLANWLWFAIFAIGNIIYIPISEEKGLRERFGDPYQRYQKNVPRWIPRLTAWDG